MSTTKEKKVSSKPRSPRSPSFTLEEAYEMASSIYREAHRNALTQGDIATILGHKTAGSGPFRPKLYTLREYGLLDEDDAGKKFTVSLKFLDLRDEEHGSPTFRRVALDLISKPKIFGSLLQRYEERVPAAEIIGAQLERENFTSDRGREVAEVFLDSLRWAGIVDDDRRFVDEGKENAENGRKSDGTDPGEDPTPRDGEHQPPAPGTRRLELPTAGGSTVVVLYPPDLSSADADMVASVLKAVGASSGHDRPADN